MKKIVVFVGPSGVGKTTICRKVARYLGIREVISVTTRSPRPDEVDGVDYHFWRLEDAQKAIEKDAFVEKVIYDGHVYGFLRESFGRGDDHEILVLVAERQGLRQIKATFGDQVESVLILPPSLEVLEERIKKGGRDADTIQRRLAKAEAEIHADLLDFDHVIVNNQMNLSVALAAMIVFS